MAAKPHTALRASKDPPSDPRTGRDHRSAARGIPRALERGGIGEGGYDAVTARQLGHARPSITWDLYGHLFEQARVADEMRAKVEAGFGHLLVDRMAASA